MALRQDDGFDEAIVEKQTASEGHNRTGNTLRNNPFDRKFQSDHALIYYEDGTPYSLNKGKRWEEVEQMKERVARKQNRTAEDGNSDSEDDDDDAIQEVVEVRSRTRDDVVGMTSEITGTNEPRRGYPGGYYARHKLGRAYAHVETTKCETCGRTPEEALKEVAEHEGEDAEVEGTKKEKKQAQKRGNNQREHRKQKARKATNQKAGRRKQLQQQDGDDTVSMPSQPQQNEPEDVDVASSEEDEVEEEGDGGEEEIEDEEAEGEVEGAKPQVSGDTGKVVPKEGRVIVVRSFEKDQYPLNRESNWGYESPCPCCFHRDGPMWMLKGTGNKSQQKTKGYRKINRRNFKQALYD